MVRDTDNNWSSTCIDYDKNKKIFKFAYHKSHNTGRRLTTVYVIMQLNERLS